MYQNPFQQIQILLNKLSDYILNVNSIIMEMNNLLNQFNNPFLNQINTNKYQDIYNNYFNQLPIIQGNSPINNIKYNACFDVSFCNDKIRKFSTPGSKIIIIIDSETTVHELLKLFFERIQSKNSIYDQNNKLSFYYKNQRIDFNNQNKIKNYFQIIKDSLINFNIIVKEE